MEIVKYYHEHSNSVKNYNIVETDGVFLCDAFSETAVTAQKLVCIHIYRPAQYKDYKDTCSLNYLNAIVLIKIAKF